MLTALSGYKTYITAAAAGLVLTAQQLGVIDEAQGKQLLEALGVLLIVFLRTAVAKSAPTT